MAVLFGFPKPISVIRKYMHYPTRVRRPRDIERHSIKPNSVGSHDNLWNSSDAQRYEEGCKSKPVL
ncbi:MAG TPA: hypothetical protein VI816_05060 [Candidatus Bathyarchaeia archaeon]|nr:hypothetical protein [Candidatus Bathyarchaeia archaeon]